MSNSEPILKRDMSDLPDTRDYKIIDETGEYMRLVHKISAEAAAKQRAKDERWERQSAPFHCNLRGPGCFPEEFFVCQPIRNYRPKKSKPIAELHLRGSLEIQAGTATP
jgi:hypothetical protein